MYYIFFSSCEVCLLPENTDKVVITCHAPFHMLVSSDVNWLTCTSNGYVAVMFFCPPKISLGLFMHKTYLFSVILSVTL